MKEIDEDIIEHEHDKELKKLRELQWNCEMVMSIKCHGDAMDYELKTGLTYKCTCEDPYKWDKNKCVEYLNEED